MSVSRPIKLEVDVAVLGERRPVDRNGRRLAHIRTCAVDVVLLQPEPVRPLKVADGHANVPLCAVVKDEEAAHRHKVPQVVELPRQERSLGGDV